MLNVPARPPYLHHLTQVSIASVLIFASLCTAQTRETTFGVVRSFDTPAPFRHVLPLPSARDGSPAFILWTDSTRELYTARFDSSFNTFAFVRHFVRIPFDDVDIAPVFRRSGQDVVLLSKSAPSLSVVAGLDADTLNPISTIGLPFVPTGWLIGDLNNDGNADIVVYSRNDPGIVPLYGNGRGKFTIGRTIVPNMPVGRLVMTNLNNDNLSDLVAYDWVKSELHLLYGVGRGRFLDQSTLPVKGNVLGMVATRLDPESILDLVLVTDGPAEVQDWQGNGIGDFRLAKQAPLEHGLISYALGDVNDDQWTDFGFINGLSSLELVINAGSEWAQDRVQFAAGDDPVGVLFRDFNNDGKSEALVLDGKGKSMRFYFSGSQDNTLRDSLELACAGHPEALSIHRTGFGPGNDLAVVCAQGRTLSLFTQRERGGLLGQTAFGLSVTPQSLAFHSTTDSSSRYVVTSGSGDSLVFLSLNFRDSSSSYAVIPSEGFAELVQVGVGREGQAEFFTFNTFPTDPNPAIHYFERLNPGTFIEQSFRLNKPDVLLGATATISGSNPYPDLVYVYRNTDSGTVDLVVSFGDSTLTYSQRHSTTELPRTGASKVYIWATPLSVGTSDLLLYFSDPTDALEIASGTESGRYDTTFILLDHVRLANRSMLQVVDADHDGVPDIVLNNGALGEIGWLRGRGDGTFEPWRALVVAEPQTFFAVGDLNGDGFPDLAVSLRSRGSVKVFNGTLMFAKERNATGR